MRDELKRVIYYNKLSFKESGIKPQQIIDLLKMLQDKSITTKSGQRIIEKLPQNTKMPRQIAEEMGLVGLMGEDIVVKVVKQVIKENPEAVSDYNEGKKSALNFLMGQVMRITRGKADPGDIFKLLEEEL
jgi:aspartyl-tRNA(Asn)/glutamyl-tRNA(Gln) amidotransferase subunit B